MSTPPGAPPPFQPPIVSPAPRFPATPAYEPPLPPRFKRPFGVTLLAILDLTGGSLALLAAALVMFFGLGAMGSPDARGGAIALVVFGVFYGLVGAYYFATAIGLWSLKNYGRVMQIVVACIGLLGVPVGTIICAMILYYLTRPGVKLLFSGAAPADLTLDQRQLVERDGNQKAVVVIVMLVAVVGGIAMLGIIAAIAIPGLLRARMAGNEASAIGTLRTMSSAQAAWNGAHGTYAAPLCLATPQNCGDTTSPSPFLAADIASLAEKNGYRFGFLLRQPHAVQDPGPGAESGEPTASDVPSDAEVQRQISQIPGAQPAVPVEPAAPDPHAAAEHVPGGFTYWAIPINPGTTGDRRFCTDETASITTYAADASWTDPTAERTGCPEGGQPLR